MNSPRLATWLEQTWLACYLDRQLTKDEAAWFEAYVMNKPELLAAIDVDSTLRDSLAADPQLDTGFRVDPAVVSAKDDQLGRRLSGQVLPAAAKKRSRLARPAGAILVSLLVGFAVGWFTHRYPLLETTSDGVLASPTRIVFDQIQAGSIRPRVEHINRALAYDLVQIALPPGAEKVSLKLGAGQTRELQAGPDGLVSFLLDHDALKDAVNAQVCYSWRNRHVTVPLDFSQIGLDHI